MKFQSAMDIFETTKYGQKLQHLLLKERRGTTAALGAASKQLGRVLVKACKRSQ